ncbi:hypothetical protein [Rubrobacter indicoceani]|uniref:hypothetical protein n=1 Tax=Rubrobacter indicoceani TaxID=2051957 RepID=UPI001968B82C|nr:hypothetical protein [Rubrobacter indicoceani]
MTKIIQIENVSDDLHRKLEERAAERGVSLPEYVLSEIEETTAKKPTMKEWLEQVASRDEAVNISTESVVKDIRRMREENDISNPG